MLDLRWLVVVISLALAAYFIYLTGQEYKDKDK